MICGALERGMTLAVGTCHSRAGGVNVEPNESSTATSGQDAALCGHQTARQYSILPPFQSFFFESLVASFLPSKRQSIFSVVHRQFIEFSCEEYISDKKIKENF